MLKNKLKILVWVPLRAGSKWRGEGIAQAIENIIKNGSPDVHYCLAISGHNYAEVEESVAGANNVSIELISFLPKRLCKKPKNFTLEKLSSPTIIDYFKSIIPFHRINFYRRIIRILTFINYGITLYVNTLLQRRNLLFKEYNIIWLPSPIIPYAEKLRGKKIISFWDPFVFEYREFGIEKASLLIKKFSLMFNCSSRIITQSMANKLYLNKVAGIDNNLIKVIYSGSPSYGEIIQDLLPEQVSREDILPFFPDKQIIAFKKDDATSIYIDDKINKTILYRLVKKLTSISKVIIVSTQFRPHKGFSVLFELLDYCIRNNSDGYDLHFIFTSQIPKNIKDKYGWAAEKVHEITRVSNKQHAVLYSISDLALHPSFVEGGPGSYPQFEAASVNVPVLNNKGRHTLEQIDVYGQQMSVTMIDFCEKESASKRIFTLLRDPKHRAENISATISAQLSWLKVGEQYTDTFKEVANN